MYVLLEARTACTCRASSTGCSAAASSLAEAARLLRPRLALTLSRDDGQPPPSYRLDRIGAQVCHCVYVSSQTGKLHLAPTSLSPQLGRLGGKSPPLRPPSATANSLLAPIHSAGIRNENPIFPPSPTGPLLESTIQVQIYIFIAEPLSESRPRPTGRPMDCGRSPESRLALRPLACPLRPVSSQVLAEQLRNKCCRWPSAAAAAQKEGPASSRLRDSFHFAPKKSCRKRSANA